MYVLTYVEFNSSIITPTLKMFQTVTLCNETNANQNGRELVKACMWRPLHCDNVSEIPTSFVEKLTLQHFFM